MTLTATKMIMHNEYDPVLRLKAQKMGVVDEIDKDPEVTTCFKAPESLRPVMVMARRNPIELTVIGKLKMITKNVESKDVQRCYGEHESSHWNTVEKHCVCYNSENYPILSQSSLTSLGKFCLPKVVKMATSEKKKFDKDITRILTSSMSSHPTLYNRAPDAREKGFLALKETTSFAKTCLCKWGSKCRNKEKCTFAHTEKELCVRMCAFGKECCKHDCHFPHNEEEVVEWKTMHIEKWKKSFQTHKLPGHGYICRSCGKKGGCDDSHWVRDCPHNKKRSTPKKGYVCKCCGQKGGVKGAHWIQQCPKSKTILQKKWNSPKKIDKRNKL